MRKRLSMSLGFPVASAVAAAYVAWAGAAEIQLAGCACSRGGGGVWPLLPVAEPVPPVPLGQPPYHGGPAMPFVDPGPASPPPGTLGRTYELPTRLAPSDKHPRTAMLNVRVTAEDVIVSHTNEFREEDDVKGFQDEADPTLWHFETKPLLPGIPHVYKVEAVNGGVTTDVRYVRLLRGRIIDLTF